MSAVGASILTVLILMVTFAPRKWALLGMMAGVLYLTQGEHIDVLGLNLFAVRFLEVAGFARVMIRREFSFSRLNEVDRALLLLYSYTTIVFLLRSTEGQAYLIGTAVDAMLCYFTFRALIGNVEDFKWFLRAFVILLAPYVVLVAVESLTAYNPFAVVGAPPWTVEFRGGRPRCVGSFRHAILLGTLGASFLPLYIGLVLAKAHRVRALAGVGLCLGIVGFSNSGGPLTAALVGLLGWLLWRVRARMSLVRRSLVGLILCLALIMKAPIWYLPDRLSSITGGSGWHRSYLMDVTMRHFDKWWLAGMPISETKGWFAYNVLATGAADITNQYLSFGINAGVVAIVLLIVTLTRSFRSLGKRLAAVSIGSSEARQTEFVLWGLGVMLTVHIVNWLAVTYFDQSYVVWFMQLAAISNCSQTAAEPVGKGIMRRLATHSHIHPATARREAEPRREFPPREASQPDSLPKQRS
jgi:hypothetical protein